MIIIQVHPPASEANHTAECMFEAYNPNGMFDLAGAVVDIVRALKLVKHIDSIEAQNGIVKVTYTVFTSSIPHPVWHEWYVAVIDGIMAYVAANFPRRGHEVLSRCPRTR